MPWPAIGQPAAAAPAPPVWTFSTDANAFFGYNYQLRQFADDWAWESQNWFMAAAERSGGASRLTVHGMLSLEPFTMAPQGSPQLFQTGESYNAVPLVNFQHPHDLLMGLGVTYRREGSPMAWVLGADLVGSPTLGPAPFMHRESARDNPQVPLSHHFMDATHITMGVLRGGVEVAGFAFEGSVFRGGGPDEDRVNFEKPTLDSWAVRGRWQRGAWNAQVSGGHMRQPEWFEPFDASLITASLGFDGTVASRPLAATLIWGGHRSFNGFNGNADAYLLEWTLGATSSDSTYGRLEVTEKELFGLGPHPKEFAHPHWYSQITALTAGYIRDLPFMRVGRLGAGADITVYRMPADIEPYYANSRSFHVFLRWRPTVNPTAHVH